MKFKFKENSNCIPITAGSVMNSTTLNLHHSQEILMKVSANRIHYSRTVLSNNIKCYPIQYMYVPFQKWNCYGIVPFQANLQFNSHSFDSISCQFIIPLQFTLKVENSRIIPIPKFQFRYIQI